MPQESHLQRKLRQLGLSGDLNLAHKKAVTQLQFKVYFPRPPYEGVDFKAAKTKEGGFNFVGLVLGHHGMTIQRIQKDTGAKIEIHDKNGNLHGDHPSPNDPTLHALILADTKERLERAAKMVADVLRPIDGEYVRFRVAPGGSTTLKPLLSEDHSSASDAHAVQLSTDSGSSSPRTAGRLSRFSSSSERASSEDGSEEDCQAPLAGHLLGALASAAKPPPSAAVAVVKKDRKGGAGKGKGEVQSAPQDGSLVKGLSWKERLAASEQKPPLPAPVQAQEQEQRDLGQATLQAVKPAQQQAPLEPQPVPVSGWSMWGSGSEPQMYQDLKQVLHSSSVQMQGSPHLGQGQFGGSPFPGASPFSGSPHFGSFPVASQLHPVPFPCSDSPILRAGFQQVGFSPLSGAAPFDVIHERNIARLVQLDSLL